MSHVKKNANMGYGSAPPPPPPPPTLGNTATAGGTATINSQIGFPFGKEEIKFNKSGQWKLGVKKNVNSSYGDAVNAGGNPPMDKNTFGAAMTMSEKDVSKLEEDDLPQDNYRHDQDHTAKLLRPHPKSGNAGITAIPAAAATPAPAQPKTGTKTLALKNEMCKFSVNGQWNLKVKERRN